MVRRWRIPLFKPLWQLQRIINVINDITQSLVSYYQVNSRTYLKIVDCLCEYLTLQNGFNLRVGCSTRNGSFRSISWNWQKTGHRFLLTFLLLHGDTVLSKRLIANLVAVWTLNVREWLADSQIERLRHRDNKIHTLSQSDSRWRVQCPKITEVWLFAGCWDFPYFSFKSLTAQDSVYKCNHVKYFTKYCHHSCETIFDVRGRFDVSIKNDRYKVATNLLLPLLWWDIKFIPEGRNHIFPLCNLWRRKIGL